MSDPLKSDTCAKYLKALAEPLRLRIIDLLRGEPQTVSEVASCLDIEIQNASHHLRVLLHAGLVVTKREGRYARYSINPEMLRVGTSRVPDILDFDCCRFELGPYRDER